MNVSYLLFFPLAIQSVLMSYVFFQNPRGQVNRLFALYMLDLTVSIYASLVMSTTPDPTLAGAAAVALLITTYALNGFFLASIILAMSYPSSLLRWYGLPLLLGISALFSIGLLNDGLFGTGILYVPHPELGQGYIASGELLAGPGRGFLRAWLFISMGVAIVLLVTAWIRTRPGERAPLSVLTGSTLAVGVIMPLLPASPLTPIIPALAFSIVFAIVVGRYRMFLPAWVTLQAVFRSAGEGMVIFDREGRVEQINTAVERMTRVPVGEVIGRAFAEAFAPFLQSAQQVEGETPLAETIATRYSEPFEALLRLEDPDLCLLSVTGVPIRDERDRLLGGLLTLRDVTEGERIRQLLAVEQEQRQALEMQQQVIREFSTPVIPIMQHIIVMPLVGTIDTMRAKDITRRLLAGIREHRAKVVILDITGVPIVDSGVASYLNKTIQAARLKGARTVVTGISDAVAETIVDMGIDWSGIETLGDLQTGLRVALAKMGRRIEG